MKFATVSTRTERQSKKYIVISSYINSVTIAFVFRHSETTLCLQQQTLGTRSKAIYSSQTFSETFSMSRIYGNVYSTMFATLFLLRNPKSKHVHVCPSVHPLIQLCSSMWRKQRDCFSPIAFCDLHMHLCISSKMSYITPWIYA